MSSPLPRRRKPRSKSPTIEATLQKILQQVGSPARVMELLYWSRERDLLEITRAIAAMPAATRETLAAFLSLSREHETIVAAFDPSGRLSLISPDVARSLDVAEAIAATAVPEISQRRH